MGEYLADERRKKITAMIDSRGSVRMSDLAKHFDVSRETIRKDLIYLDNLRIIKKTHGGANSLRESSERPLSMRVFENTEKKSRIAEKALEYIEDNQVVVLDAGSTVLALAKLLSADSNNTLVTNSLSAAVALAEKNLSFCLIGGDFSCTTMSTGGLLATQAMRMLNADVAFLGTSGLQYVEGPSAKTLYDAQSKTDIMRNCQKNIVLADSSKFSENGFVQYASWSEVDLLITDSEIPGEILKELRKKVQVVICDV